ncbi:MAG: DoxX family membrane protein [Flavobacteriales bacterium]|nr:DoxX family membrane protein [Flavobacteriales bacterium]
MNTIVTICRILVGSLFIVSGLIKVNDVVGFGYKLEEYFAESALNFPGLVEYVLPIAIFIVIGEVLLGIALLLGAWPKITTSLILFMTVFFLWLTNYTASCIDEREDFKPSASVASFPKTCVETCGCFGDAIPLEPRQSFYKDVILLIFVIPVFLGAWTRRFKLNTWNQDMMIIGISLLLIAAFSILQLDWWFPISFTIIACGLALVMKKYFGPKEWLMALAALVVCAYVQYDTYNHLPYKDYRGYAIGKNILDQMKPASVLYEEYKEKAIAAGDSIKTAKEVGLAEPKTLAFYTLKNKNTGATKEVDSDQYMSSRIWEDTTWSAPIPELTYSKVMEKGYTPKIMDFAPTDMDGNEMKDSLLALDKVFWIISKDISHWDKAVMDDLKAFTKKAQADGIPVYAITPADYEQAETFRHENGLDFPFLINDQIELKIIVRSNPGIVYLEKATVMNMWSKNDIPDYDKVKADK